MTTLGSNTKWKRILESERWEDRARDKQGDSEEKGKEACACLPVLTGDKDLGREGQSEMGNTKMEAEVPSFGA